MEGGVSVLTLTLTGEKRMSKKIKSKYYDNLCSMIIIFLLVGESCRDRWPHICPTLTTAAKGFGQKVTLNPVICTRGREVRRQYKPLDIAFRASPRIPNLFLCHDRQGSGGPRPIRFRRTLRGRNAPRSKDSWQDLAHRGVRFLFRRQPNLSSRSGFGVTTV